MCKDESEASVWRYTVIFRYGGVKNGSGGMHPHMCEAPARADRKKRLPRKTSVQK